MIDHLFFQRLRQVRQNDVAFYVYPSLNTSRFEHVLGSCRVAGMMAEHLTKSPKWSTYFGELKRKTDIATKEEFVELCRLYALLHDIGHLPLSHLFEMAVGEQSNHPAKTIKDWTGTNGFNKLHEAFGALVIKQLMNDVPLPNSLQLSVTRLMIEKELPLDDPLSIVKKLVDSEIDADRVDFVQRDGLLAGGEYGNYDIRRLCDSVFIEKDERGWLIAYSEKALTTMEALLLDRYRSHVWVHFHHRVVATKMLVQFLIKNALDRSLIDKSHFNPKNIETFALRDDVWLWGVLRNTNSTKNPILNMIKHAVFYRAKKDILTLWKSRPTYHELQDQVKQSARINEIETIDYGLDPDRYKKYLEQKLGVQILMFRVPFEPTSKEAVLLYSEDQNKLTGKNLLDVSRLVENLGEIWKNEPQEFILLVGKNVSDNASKLKEKWVEHTARFIKQ